MRSCNSFVLIFAATVIVTGAVFSDAHALEIDWAEVGDPGNEESFNGNGAVDYVFSMGRYEVTNAEYASFLNAVDPGGTNPLSLYNADMTDNSRGGIDFIAGNASGSKYQPKSTFAERPVNYVSWYDAARFANWMHNGQGAGGTESGAYDMALTTPLRLEGATIALPSNDEWYKAAYYAPAKPYWLYPTRSDTAPESAQLDADGYVINSGANVANWDSDATVSVVGSAGGTGSYGTHDQAGNVSEWTEEVYSSSYRGDKGGNWAGGSIRADSFGSVNTPTNEGSTRGFRLVMLAPEPAGALLPPAAIATLAALRRRRSRHR